MNSILCFGDSISYGEGDSQSGGWVEQLKRRLINVTVFNLGIPGETTDGLRLRIEFEVQRRILRSKKTTIILNYGANDIVVHKKAIKAEKTIRAEKAIKTGKEEEQTSNIKPSTESPELICNGQQVEHKLVVPLSFFERNITEALSYAKAINADVIMLSLLPIHSLDDGVNNCFDQVKYDASVIAYNEKLRQLAKHFDATFIDLYSCFLNASNQQSANQSSGHLNDDKLKLSHTSLFCNDRVHPNSHGHRRIADKVELLIRQNVEYL